MIVDPRHLLADIQPIGHHSGKDCKAGHVWCPILEATPENRTNSSLAIALLTTRTTPLHP
jgi:hypothetical protein